MNINQFKNLFTLYSFQFAMWYKYTDFISIRQEIS